MALEELKEDQKLQLEQANKEFNELNKLSNFNVSNIVPDKTKFVIKSLSDGTKNKRTIFLFLFQFLSNFYKHAVLLITLINYIKNAKINNDINRHHIQSIYLLN